MFKILVMGLPGSGKTTLAKRLALLNKCVHINADVARATINADLGFSVENRIENARRLGCIADLLNMSGFSVVTDFVCPTEQTRKIFNANFVIWMNTINEGRFEDTNKLFDPPISFDVCIENFSYDIHKVQSSIINKFYLKHPEKSC